MPFADSTFAQRSGRRGGLGGRGFTLFEILATLCIIGIAAATIVPAVGTNIRSPRLRTAANVLAADIDFCASECIAQPGAPRALSFDATNNKYTMIDSNSGTTSKFPGDGMDYVNDFSTGRNSQLSDVSITRLAMGAGTLTVLTFDSYGKPVITADFIITLTYKTQTILVTVKQGTGDVTITGG